MSIKKKIKSLIKDKAFKASMNGNIKSTPLYIYEVPKPANYEELVKKVKENHPELNQ